MALIAPAIARLKRNATRAALGIGLIVVFGGFGLAYLLIALSRLLEREIGPLWTPVAIGGVLCLAALGAYLALLRPRARPHASHEAAAIGLPPELAAPMRNLETRVAKNPLASIAVAVGAGFAAAALLRMLRGRRYPASPWPPGGVGAAQPRPGTGTSERPSWMREVLLRETERRKSNGRGA